MFWLFHQAYKKDELLGQLSYIWWQDWQVRRERESIRKENGNIENKSGIFILKLNPSLNEVDVITDKDKVFSCYVYILLQL